MIEIDELMTATAPQRTGPPEPTPAEIEAAASPPSQRVQRAVRELHESLVRYWGQDYAAALLLERELAAAAPFECAVRDELRLARQQHPRPFNSPHEGLAILLEEVDELQRAVFRRERDQQFWMLLQRELTQVAAVARRFAEDLQVFLRAAGANPDQPRVDNRVAVVH